MRKTGRRAAPFAPLIFLPVALLAQAPAPPAPPRPPAASGSAAAPQPVTDDEKTVYSLGLSVYKALLQFDLTPAELALVRQAIIDAEANKPAVDLSAWGPKIDALAKARVAQITEREKAASAAYLTKAAAEPGMVKTESGLIYHEDRAGTGASPMATDTVRVNYAGKLVNGTEFDSSYKRNEPAQFALNGVIKCWTEGVQKMKVGGKSTLICPSDLAYGDQGRPSIPGGATLIFEIELLDVVAGFAK
jgi:FKBP-type peptidyl-prolyl cis-trans isomerase FkpA